MTRKTGTALIVAGMLWGLAAATWAQEEEVIKPIGGRADQEVEVKPIPAPATQASQPSNARMELSPKDFEFGEIWQGSPCEREFTIKNTGTDPLTVSAKSSCGCTVPTQPKSPLPPGETTTFKITYSTAHKGVAAKTVTLTTNDSTQPSVVINVKGEVKAIYEATPTDRVMFTDADPKGGETMTVTLTNKYHRPLNLKLKDQDYGAFDVELKPIEEGQKYELTAKTKANLKNGWNRVSVAFDTGEEKVPPVTVEVTANVFPKVQVIPSTLMVSATASQPVTQLVQVKYRLAEPIKVTEVKSTIDAVKCEVLPNPESVPGGKAQAYQLRVTLPPHADMPDEGAHLEIYTDDPSPEFHKIDIPIVKGRRNPGVVAPTKASPQ